MSGYLNDDRVYPYCRCGADEGCACRPEQVVYQIHAEGVPAWPVDADLDWELVRPGDTLHVTYDAGVGGWVVQAWGGTRTSGMDVVSRVPFADPDVAIYGVLGDPR